MNQADAAVGLILWTDHILLLKRGKTAPHYPGEFCLPGGHRDGSESPLEAVVRETFEETGIFVPRARWRWHEQQATRTNRPLHVDVFWTRVVDPAVRLSYEHDSYVWHPVGHPVPDVTTPMTMRVVDKAPVLMAETS